MRKPSALKTLPPFLRTAGDVLGKVLYYSLSSILIDRDELESLCDAVGFPKGRSNRTAMGDAFRSATGDIYERR